MLSNKHIIVFNKEVIKKLDLTSPLEIMEGDNGFYLKSTRYHKHYNEYIVCGYFWRNGYNEETFEFPGIKKIVVFYSESHSYEITFDDGTTIIVL